MPRINYRFTFPLVTKMSEFPVGSFVIELKSYKDPNDALKAAKAIVQVNCPDLKIVGKIKIETVQDLDLVKVESAEHLKQLLDQACNKSTI